MRWIRRLVYWLGFRPDLGSIFHSPSAHWTLASQKAWDLAWPHILVNQTDWTVTPVTGNPGLPWDEALDRFKRNLEELDETLKKAYGEGLLIKNPVSDDEKKKQFAKDESMDATFPTSQGGPNTRDLLKTHFYCPLCGRKLARRPSDFFCPVDLSFEIELVNGRIVVKTQHDY